MAALEHRHWWFVARRRILETVLTRAVPLSPGSRLLEVGCGTGGNLPMLARFGQVAAIEPEASARRFAGAKGRFDVCCGSLPDDVPFADESLDLVLALDVLEHLETPEASLRTIARKLRDGGWLLVTVPAFAFLWSRHDDLHHHKRRYSKAQLLRQVRAAGFAPIHVSYFNALLFPLIAAIRLLKRLLGRDGDDDVMPPLAINRLLTVLFASERHLIGRVPLPFGVSLLMVARKCDTHG